MQQQNFNWESFKSTCNTSLEKGTTLFAMNPKNQIEFEEFSNEYKLWKTEVLDYLISTFSRDNYYVLNFRPSISRFSISGQQKPIEQQIREKKEDLNSDIRYLKFILEMVGISDKYTKPQEIDLSIRQNYTSEEIIELLLQKLYDLYGDGIYPVIQILEGNGVTLKKRREEYEYVSTLEDYGYVTSSNITREADAQLTLTGKRYIEEKRKTTKPNYNSIADDSGEINSKIDELKKQLEKLGYGQEIIFEELEELKEYYTVLNKKSWAQLFKGKLFDLGASQVISWDVMKMMYESIVHDTLKLQ